MKIAERVFIGLLGTALLTTVILFALDAYNSHLKTVQLASLLETGESDAKDKAGAGQDETSLFVDSREPRIVYQAREDDGTAEALIAQHNLQDLNESSSTESVKQDQQTDTQAKKQEGQAGSDQDGRQSNSGEKTGGKEEQQTSDKTKRPLKFENVEEDYFSDALFIGDSRTVGMQQSGLLPGAAYYAKTGIGISNILDKRIVNEGGVMLSVQEALRRHSFGKVYIMIGINDISAGDTEWFIGQYKKILEEVRRTQPDAVIYIQGNIPMSYNTQDMNGALNNKNLAERNEASRALADGRDIFYLDIDEIYADGNGNLASMYTGDGLHIDTDHYPIWVDYLMHHAVVK